MSSAWQGWTFLLMRNCHVHLNHALQVEVYFFKEATLLSSAIESFRRCKRRRTRCITNTTNVIVISSPFCCSFTLVAFSKVRTHYNFNLLPLLSAMFVEVWYLSLGTGIESQRRLTVLTRCSHHTQMLHCAEQVFDCSSVPKYTPPRNENVDE